MDDVLRVEEPTRCRSTDLRRDQRGRESFLGATTWKRLLMLELQEHGALIAQRLLFAGLPLNEDEVLSRSASRAPTRKTAVVGAQSRYIDKA